MFYPETWQSAGVTESTDQPGGITAQYPPVCSGQAPSHGPQYRQTVRNGLYFGHKPLKYQSFRFFSEVFIGLVFLTLLIYSIYFIYRYRERNNEGSRSNTSTFYLLLDLLTFFDSYHEGNVDEAFEVHRIFLVYNFCNFFFLKIWYIWISSICMCKLVIYPDILDFSV